MSSFIEDNPTNPHAFIQWKGTDVCMDFHCDCGAHCHFDGDFAYAVKCPHCETIWEMPCNIVPRRADERTYPDHVRGAKLMEPDGDYADEVTGADGVTRWVAYPRDKYKGERAGPPVDEAEHFYQCKACGAWVDKRDLGMVFDHEGPLPHPDQRH